MGVFAAGEFVSLPFPHTDLSPGKLRPVLHIASAGREDWIVCQITSNPYSESNAILLSEDDFLTGGLPRVSYLRPSKLFTAHESLISGTLGSVKASVLNATREAVAKVIRVLKSLE